MKGKKNITIVEVGPRDGLQNIAHFIPTSKKAEIINKMVDAGEKQIEFSSFVHPEWIPQLADVEQLYDLIKDRKNVTYRALVANEKGLERAIAIGVKSVVWVVAATDRGNLDNVNMTTEQSLELVRRTGERLGDTGVKLCGIIACALGDPLEGDVPVKTVIEVSEAFQEAGAADISLADTIGIANPQKVRQMVTQLVEALPHVNWGIHLHNIMGLGMANALAAWESGIATFESSVAGLGGCPYAPHPGGNIATEELVYLMATMGVDTGIDLGKLLETRDFVRSVVQSPLS